MARGVVEAGKAYYKRHRFLFRGREGMECKMKDGNTAGEIRTNYKTTAKG
jgi:hypothetical protein